MNVVEAFARAIGNDGFPGVAGLTYSDAAGGNVFVARAPSAPHREVSVYPSGGFAGDSLPYDRPTIQVVVRGDEDPRWALDMWQAVFDRVEGMRSVELPGGIWLVSCLSPQTGPVHMGPDANRRYRFGLNLELEVKNVTAERPDHV